MLDSETKRRIDTARDILVGKVPDPKSQVEQITIALIYKFMDDMDTESEELGGERSFFKGEFEKYAWRRIFDPRMGGFEILNLYSEAIVKMNVNPNIPQLFRDIFKNAYLPYRDPETLKAFLKAINEFSYDHSERLGDAFEYILSVLGSQGDAGQFRTPRHIIDFMVAIVDPKKDEVILDPACGTSGFLISSYKHIIKNNSTNYDPEKDIRTFESKGQSLSELIINSKNFKGDKLIPDERNRLANNIKGYDISPDMVKLSLVNMYLHGVHSPHIYEYDTLTSEDNWNEYADVILANPPFMTPKGGIRPHKRFSITSNRSEVLFVDYITEHLTPDGRAVVIVPEGIIFQSGTAYKKLRKMLVEKYLVGVISLPAGVFYPYSGVKTSILWLDRILAKKTDKILFIKVENDGFDLGAQRRPIEKNDLPDVLKILHQYRGALNKGTDAHLVKGLLTLKEEILHTNDVNLSAEHYKKQVIINSEFPLINLGDDSVFQIESGGTPKSDDPGNWGDEINWITLVDLPSDNLITNIITSERTITKKGLTTSSAKLLPVNSVIVSTRATIGRVGINRIELATNQGFKNIIIKDPNKAIPEFVALMVTNLKDRMVELATGGTFKELSKTNFSTLKIPLPPNTVQKVIVAEIESYQKIIDGARQVVANFKPRIDIDPEWPLMELRNMAQIINGRAFKQEELLDKGKYPVLRVGNLFSNKSWYYSDLELDHDKYCDYGDLLFAWSASFGPKIWDNGKVIYHYHIWKIVNDPVIIDKMFLYYMLGVETERIKSEGGRGIAMIHITKEGMERRKFPYPPLSIQNKIIENLNKEQSLIQSNRELIVHYEQKIMDRLAKVWGKK